MSAWFQSIDRHPVRVSIVLTLVLAVIELTVLMVPRLGDSTLGVALILPIVGAFAGGLIVRSWWWPLIYVAGFLIGMAVWITLGMQADGSLEAANVAGGVIAGSSVLLGPVILFALIGPLLSAIHRRFGPRTAGSSG